MKIKYFIKQTSCISSDITTIKWSYLCVLLCLPSTFAHAEQQSNTRFIEKIVSFLGPQPDENFKTAQLQQLTNFRNDQSNLLEIHPANQMSQSMSLIQAVRFALQRNPDIAQRISILAAQNSNVTVAKSQYYPQISGGLGTGDLMSSNRGRQVLSLNATQMVYDFGKVKSSVNTQQQKVFLEQANVLVSIDDIAYQVSFAIVNIERYRSGIQIAEQQIKGISHILEIANLRAQAGISSQADPIQAESFLQSAQSNLIAQQSMLQQYQQRLSLLLGFDVSKRSWVIPDQLIAASNLYAEPQFNIIPRMIAAQAEIEIAKSEKKQTDLTRYPTLSLKGGISQAINGDNPNNNNGDRFDQSIMFEASSNFYQGGATTARVRAASFAEEAAKAKVNAVYLAVLDQIRTTRETIENKQRQMQVLSARQNTTVRTRELYQEQYKLGTRTVLDLLNAEIAIHSASSELENARYDIYSSLAQYIGATGLSRQAYDLNNISIQGFEVQP
ncbi:adhesin transport system outer membrane protein [Acinetobacter calcoaceticus]|uniref:Adhesin transport system outer membrane protein n=1 Tax=Acinetobacter calcoaceticus TaxID=471 RepID=A0A4R1XK49_ACICA|nr:adhesin transport system outer membrane protein [Acinetobacter calcoaceticus]